MQEFDVDKHSLKQRLFSDDSDNNSHNSGLLGYFSGIYGLEALGLTSEDSFKSFGANYLFGLQNDGAEEPSNVDRFPVHADNSNLLTLFLLINTIVGSGVWHQPVVFRDTGVIPATLLLVFTAFFTWLGLVSLVDVGAKYEIFDFSDLATFAFGRWAAVIVDASIVIGNFGAVMTYIVLIGSTAADALTNWGCDRDHHFICRQQPLTFIIMSVFVLPLCMVRIFGGLAHASVYSVVVMIGIVLLAVIGGPIVGSGGGDIVESRGAGLLTQLGPICFLLSGSFGAFHTYVSLRKASAALWRQLSAIAMIVSALMLFAIGLAGYASFRGDTDSNLVDNFSGSYDDVFRLLLIIHLILYIPIYFLTMRHSLLKLGSISSGSVNSTLGHVLITFVLLAVVTAVVLVLNAKGFSDDNAFNLIIAFSGGLAGGIISFIMPAAFYLKLSTRTAPLYSLCAVMLCIGVVVSVMVPILAIFQYS